MEQEQAKPDARPSSTEVKQKTARFFPSPLQTALPPLEVRQREFALWKLKVRDPAHNNSEGVRRIECDGATAEYEIAPLPNGKWAVRMSINYSCGNCWGRSSPWSVFPTRRDCVDSFLNAARTHFKREFHPADSCTSEKQRRVRLEMIERLSDSLFGFIEPSPQSFQ